MSAGLLPNREGTDQVLPQSAISFLVMISSLPEQRQNDMLKAQYHDSPVSNLRDDRSLWDCPILDRIFDGVYPTDESSHGQASRNTLDLRRYEVCTCQLSP